MGSKIILVDREDVEAVEAEEQLHFVFSVLQASGLPEEKLEPCFDAEFSVENKINLRKLCEKEQISIVSEPDSSLKIYIQDNNKDILIARWSAPIRILRMNGKAIESANKMFVEIKFEWWTMEEENNDATS